MIEVLLAEHYLLILTTVYIIMNFLILILKEFGPLLQPSLYAFRNLTNDLRG